MKSKQSKIKHTLLIILTTLLPINIFSNKSLYHVFICRYELKSKTKLGKREKKKE